MDQNDEKSKRWAAFLEAKRKRREAECISYEERINRAKEILSSPGCQDFFRKMAEKNSGET
jgi:hypothetical protein